MEVSKMAMSIGDLFPVVLTLTLVGVTLGVGVLIMGKFATSLSNGTTNPEALTAQSALNDSVTAINDIPATWLPIIVVVIAAAIIVSLVVRSFRA
jgi:hypothetical protein